MKNKIIALLILAMAALPALAQTVSSEVGVTAQAVSTPSQSMVQNVAAADPWQGRWFANSAGTYSAPVLPYLGPWSSGANIIEDLRVLPGELTMAQAKSLYNGGVKARINRMSDGSYQFQTCRLYSVLPETYTRVAYIFLQGNKKANTVDVIAKAAMEAMKAGANGIYLIKKVTLNATQSTGWGIGFGSVTGTLSGQSKETAQTSSGGTGWNRATALPVYLEGMVVLAIK